MTTLAEELAEQERWHRRAKADMREILDSLLHNEFAEPRVLNRWISGMLLSLCEHARSEIPYYRDLFSARKVTPADLAQAGGLAQLPLLTKHIVQEQGARLRCDGVLKPGRKSIATMTSGTTGRPTQVFHTEFFNWFFSVLKQREYRWFRFAPEGRLAAIRLPSQLPKGKGMNELAEGETRRLKAWPQMEAMFETGPYFGFSITNGLPEQIDWLRAVKPDYLTTYSESLEHLVFACCHETPCESLHGLLAISEQLTPGMRRRIEGRFRTPVHQNYGLNEVGLVAVRCEAGRYHVHAENCVVELLDDAGEPQKPGRPGRVVVTTLRNRRMPLIRYDTDDLAEVVDGDCPCGRTLPAFGNILGRYSRIAYLPEGTLGRVGAIRAALEEMPAELSRNLRQIQVHQFRDNSFELRLGVAAPLPRGFAESIQAAWDASAPKETKPLSILELSQIPREPGGKFQDFTSDFVPRSDNESANSPSPGGAT